MERQLTCFSWHKWKAWLSYYWRRTDFVKELHNIHFKEALIKFLIILSTLGERNSFVFKKIWNGIFFWKQNCFFNFDYYYKFEVFKGRVVKTVEENFTCTAHEKANTKIIHHVCNINYDANILIRCSDTDILIIMLGNMQNMKNNLKIWIEVSVGNNQRIINVKTTWKLRKFFVCFPPRFSCINRLRL